MRHTVVFKRAASGMAAGLAGTLVIQALQAAGQKAIPARMPPLREHPGEFMVHQAEKLLPSGIREKVPRSLEKGAAGLLGVGYGLTFGTLFEFLHRRRGNLFLEGTGLGVICWAAGYLGWLPASGIMPPVYRQKPGQVAGSIASHLAFGLSTVGVLRYLRRRGMAGLGDRRRMVLGI